MHIKRHPAQLISQKGKEIIEQYFLQNKIISEPGYRLVIGRSGGVYMSCMIEFNLKVCKKDGTLKECRTVVFGPPAAIIVASILKDFSIGKTYEQINNITPIFLYTFIESKKTNIIEYEICVEVAIEAIINACEGCSDITPKKITPIAELDNISTDINWDSASDKEKHQAVELVIEKSINPFIKLDEGFISVDNITGNDIKIQFHGACQSCAMSYKSTIVSIQKALRQKISPKINVI